MRYFVLILALIVSLASVAFGQDTILADRFLLNTGPCTLSSGSGSPELNVVGKICDTYLNTADGVIWTKWSGNNTTSGWMVGFNTHARVNGNTTLTGYVGDPSYVSQLIGWRIDQLGAADFRYVTTDQLHAKSFTVDLEQALAGGQIITKSVAEVANNFTAPAPGAAATLVVKDLPSAENMAVFETGDTIRLRTFSRTSGSLNITDAFGTVSGYADQVGGTQAWTFTRNTAANAGLMAAGTVVQARSLALDYGVSGNGFIEQNAIDGIYGINSPYIQTATWSVSPVAANLTLRSRMGNLRGITGVTGEYGAILGTYAATGGQYVRVSNQAVELHGVNLTLWDGATPTLKLDRTLPSFALGSPIPSAYATGTGCWMGKDAGVYKSRCGVPGGAGFFWDGSTFAINGVVTANSGTIGGFTIGATTLSATNIQMYSGAGAHFLVSDGATNWAALFAGSSGSDVAIMAGGIVPGAAPFRVTMAGALTATNATITGAITATSGSFTGNGSGITSINGGNITASTVTATQLNVSTLSAISANLGTVTAGSITGVTATFASTVTLNSSGITIDAGTGSVNKVKWTDGSQIWSQSDDLWLESDSDILLHNGTTEVGLNAGSFRPNTSFSADLGTSGTRWDGLWIQTIDATGNIETDSDILVNSGNIYISNLGGSGRRYLCIENNGAISADGTAC